MFRHFLSKNNLSGGCEKVVNTIFSKLPDNQNKNLRFLGFARKSDEIQVDLDVVLFIAGGQQRFKFTPEHLVGII